MTKNKYDDNTKINQKKINLSAKNIKKTIPRLILIRLTFFVEFDFLFFLFFFLQIFHENKTC